MSKKDTLKNLRQSSSEARWKKVGTVKITEEWIEDKVLELFVILNILRPSINVERNVRTFIRLLYREAGCLVE